MATPATLAVPELTPSEYCANAWEAAQSYINEVLAGTVRVGRLERLAVERFVFDLEDGAVQLDREAADRVFRFFSVLRHTKTRQWAGRQFLLTGWQAFVLLNLFGLIGAATGLRVYRIAYIQIARKNGKSTFAAGIALYLLTYDGEIGAEVYSAATKKDQAKIVWKDAREMVRQSPGLRQILGVREGVSNIYYTDQGAKFEPVGQDADTLDGLNPHGVVVDELHAHKSRAMWDVMITGMGARLQPMQLAITTAGVDFDGVCYEQRDYGVKVLEEVVEDREYFAFICELDDGDDWLDEDNWRKGNPNLGVSVRLEELRTAAKRAAAIPSQQNDFRTKRLDEWTQQQTRWLDMEAWRALPQEEVPFVGRKCFAGLDLSSTRDVSALVLVFPPDQYVKTWALLPFMWVPHAAVLRAKQERRAPYDAWVRDGWLNETPGNVIDYDFIRAKVQDLGELYRIKEIGYDPYNATQLIVQLESDGFSMVKMRQGVQTLHAPCKELERLITAGEINPTRSPVLRWMASNVTVIRDSNGNMKPSRENERLKIDGIVAAIMGLGRAIATDEDGERDRADALVLRAPTDDD